MTTRRRGLKLSRDGVLFGVGILGIIYETLVVGGDRPTLLVLFGAMVGLPAFLRTDERMKNAPPPEPAAPAPDAEPPEAKP